MANRISRRNFLKKAAAGAVGAAAAGVLTSCGSSASSVASSTAASSTASSAAASAASEAGFTFKPGTYTVTEETGWSWRYTPKANGQKVKPENAVNGVVTVTFENTR